MYFWKCWRDTRTAFLVMAGGGLFMAGLGFLLVFDVGGWTSSRSIPEMWLSTGHILIAVPMFVMPLAGFLLGAYGVGDELGKGSAAFLLSHPRSRRYLMWVNWLVGAGEIVALMLLAVLLRALGPAHPAYPGRRLNVFDLRDIVMTTVLAVAIYSLTFFFTTAFRSGRLGTNVAFATVFSYYGLLAWLALNFQIYLPPLSGPYYHKWSGFPWHVLTENTGWLGFVLLLVYASQLLFERAEA
jgi:ABC-type transport system involved in multi-copper enzyme maturation permease subunit